MIIWIDGTNGVEKSHVAVELADRNIEYVESALYWMDFHSESFLTVLQ